MKISINFPVRHEIFLLSLSLTIFPVIRSSYAELGKLGYTMDNEELRDFNDKLLVQVFSCDPCSIHVFFLILRIKEIVIESNNSLREYHDH
jgi:hypothetical protein